MKEELSQLVQSYFEQMNHWLSTVLQTVVTFQFGDVDLCGEYCPGRKTGCHLTSKEDNGLDDIEFFFTSCERPRSKKKRIEICSPGKVGLSNLDCVVEDGNAVHNARVPKACVSNTALDCERFPNLFYCF